MGVDYRRERHTRAVSPIANCGENNMTDQQHTGHDLLTITEAAALLRAPVANLRYWRHLGTGPRSFRLGRRVLYRRNDLHAWIEGQCNEAVDRRPRSGQSTSPARARRPDGCQSPLLTSP